MEDLRLQWMKDLIYRFLLINANDEAFDELISDENNHKILSDIFSGSKESERCTFFYSDIIEEEIEKDDMSEKSEEIPKTAGSQSSRSKESVSDIVSSESSIEKEKEPDEKEDEIPKPDEAEDVLDEEASNTDFEENSETAEEIASTKYEEKATTSLKLIVKKTKLFLVLNISKFVPGRSYVYFHLRKLEPIPSFETFEEANRIMPQYFELGCLNHHPLICFDKTISLLYKPLFEDENRKVHMSDVDYPVDETQISVLSSDFIREMEDFTNSTQQIISQIEKPFMFTLPKLPEDSNLEDLAHETEYVTEAQEITNEWSSVLSNLFQEISEKNPPENSLLGEIEFWKTQQLQLSICTDQMSHSTISKTIKILKLAEVDIRRFETNATNIEDLLSKVTDNMTYLSLLEQNAKYLLSENSKENSKKVLFDSFVVLKVAWVQSNYFNTDENMCRLLKGISMLIQNQVKKEAQIDMLFRKPLPEISKIARESIEILEYWKELYLDESEKIKKFGGSYWWRFDTRIFFDEIDHMVSVCQDVSRVSQTDVDAFNPISKSEWDRIIRIFFRDVQSFEDQMKLFIGKMFQTSLTWENAYILCKSFDQFSISSSIREFILKSRTDMLKQFIKEISETENHFLTHERDPPKLEAIPKITSAILWVRHLLKKISKPMSKISDFLTKKTKDIEVQERFERVEKILISYQKDQYEVWKVSAHENLTKFLQANILKKFQSHPTELKSAKEAVMYRVNFPAYLEEVSTEAKILEELEYEIPTFVKNVILQAFFEAARMITERKTEIMVNIYVSLVPLLKKVEAISCKTFTGKAEEMRDYYYACERKILQSLKTMMISNLEYFRDEILENYIYPYVEMAFKSEEELITSSILRIKLIFVNFITSALERYLFLNINENNNVQKVK
ncbi:dynein-1-alpha heavy chain, flagellar inner arm I1 complex [Trichonephila inaurata madagascariensis]|uniref:Dynein-1-alpha heavy chain, flagellar inner arm I1 complex n=1 Tax=Trichonephila inaurata madagascariensis TaxID=2747483 RepID=A0A8X6WVQ5_9ARAC|nr:dynein-1-alpha heavy chain, flagellar inner arm I1 complex [Trichonephila inaurata madagascariensis]